MEENLDPSIAALLASVTPSDPDAGASAQGDGGDSPDVFGGMGAKESNFEQMIMEQSAPQKKERSRSRSRFVDKRIQTDRKSF